LHAGCLLVGVSGVGLSLQEAFQGCIGEGIGYLSQFQTGSDLLLSSGVAIRLPSLVRRLATSSPLPRRTVCVRMLGFHGILPSGSPIVAGLRPCCRQICVCAGRWIGARAKRCFH
jgi:hypothetical protein